MNRQPFETPPQWWPPKLSPFMIRVWRSLRRYQQVRQHRLLDIDVRGAEHLQAALAAGQGVVITPNHSSHADSYVLYHAAELLTCPLYFMTAWQVFGMSSRLESLVMQHHGCFSVDREGTDMRAFKQAVEIVQQRPHPLVIFPEGEVYHLNERITPFREGAAAIAMTAARKAERPITVVPCAIHYNYQTDPTPELLQVMQRLEEQISWRVRSDLSLHDRIYRFADGMIALKEVEYLGRSRSGPLAERVADLSDVILERLAERHGVKEPEGLIIPERVKNLRRQVISRLDELDKTDAAREPLVHDMDDLFLVVQMFSYPGNYVSERPSIERMAETIDKFEEDFLNAPTAGIRGTRNAVVTFGDPLPVPVTRDRATGAELTRQLEVRVQRLMDETLAATPAVEEPRRAVGSRQ